MTLQLRNNKNRTIVDIEIFETKDTFDVSVAFDIKQYSELLLGIDDKKSLIEDFSELNSLRGYLWEIYMETQNPSINGFVKEVKSKLIYISELYSLFWNED